LKNVLKSLLLIGGNLSHSREYRDLFEDIVVKVLRNHSSLPLTNFLPQIGEPLHDELGLNRSDMNRLLIHCNSLVSTTQEMFLKKFSSSLGRDSMTSQSSTPTAAGATAGQGMNPGSGGHSQSGGPAQQQRKLFEKKLRNIDKDWIRFVTCCRICLWNFYAQ
jgi:hypothetical protein